MATLQHLGEDLYGIIEQVYPEMAGKLTGMLLELGEEECRACLGNQIKLAERLDEAMRILDDSGQGAIKPAAVENVEKRVDPQDGQLRSLEELHSLYAGVYSRKEIEQYWLFCTPTNSSKSAEPVRVPATVEAKPTGLPVSGGEAAADAATAAASSTASCVDEALPGLTAWFRELKLIPYLAAADSWIEEQGACSLDEIVENLEDFAAGLHLKPLEQKRLQKLGASTVEQAKAEAVAALAERKAQEASSQHVHANAAKAPLIAGRGAVARSSPPEEERFPPLSAAAGRGGIADRGKGPRKRI